MPFTSSGPRFGLSSAKSYTSVSGTSSGVAFGSSTSGSSFAGSSFASNQFALKGRISAKLTQGLPIYTTSIRKPGDVFFHVDDNYAGHTNMTAKDVSYKIDSVDPDGVRKVEILRDRHPALVFRFSDEAVARRAALLAEEWVGEVKYSDGAVGFGVTFRVLGAVFGSCKFGTGAQARLMKYRSRPNLTPKNVICSEMCVLAYQLSMKENDPGFIKLDAKHTLPSDLMKYFLGAGRSHWTLIAYRP